MRHPYEIITENQSPHCPCGVHWKCDKCDENTDDHILNTLTTREEHRWTQKNICYHWSTAQTTVTLKSIIQIYAWRFAKTLPSVSFKLQSTSHNYLERLKQNQYGSIFEYEFSQYRKEGERVHRIQRVLKHHCVKWRWNNVEVWCTQYFCKQLYRFLDLFDLCYDM